jgi:hypothetical protein
MNRGALLLGLGITAAMAGAHVGCGSSSSAGGGGGTTSDAGNVTDGTTADTGVAAEAAVETGTIEDSGTAEDASEAAVCAAANAFFQDPERAQCTGEHCCSQLTACVGASGCVAIFQCVVACLNQNGITEGNIAPCNQACEADAEGVQDYSSAQSCVFTSCGYLWFDGGTD